MLAWGMDISAARICALVGKTVDEPDIQRFAEELGKKFPKSLFNMDKNVVAKKHGLELHFSLETLHVDYPQVPRNKSRWVPRLDLVWLTPKYPGEIPFGVRPGMTTDELTEVLGEPEGRVWKRVLDAERGIVLAAWAGINPTIQVDTSQALDRFNTAMSALFACWALARGFLEPGLVPAALRGQVQGRAGSPADIMQAFPRGLWNTHVPAKDGFRSFAMGYFHRIGYEFAWKTDLIEIFGSRKGEHGHAEPVLDQDTLEWEMVDKASTLLDERFAKWV